jgi:ribosomal protein S11
MKKNIYFEKKKKQINSRKKKRIISKRSTGEFDSDLEIFFVLSSNNITMVVYSKSKSNIMFSFSSASLGMVNKNRRSSKVAIIVAEKVLEELKKRGVERLPLLNAQRYSGIVKSGYEYIKNQFVQKN